MRYFSIQTPAHYSDSSPVKALRTFAYFAYHCQYAYLNDALKDYLHALEVPSPETVTTRGSFLISYSDYGNKAVRSIMWCFFRTLNREVGVWPKRVHFIYISLIFVLSRTLLLPDRFTNAMWSIGSGISIQLFQGDGGDNIKPESAEGLRYVVPRLHCLLEHVLSENETLVEKQTRSTAPAVIPGQIETRA